MFSLRDLLLCHVLAGTIGHGFGRGFGLLQVSIAAACHCRGGGWNNGKTNGGYCGRSKQFLEHVHFQHCFEDPASLLNAARALIADPLEVAN
jgi:hypothetical protein